VYHLKVSGNTIVFHPCIYVYHRATKCINMNQEKMKNNLIFENIFMYHCDKKCIKMIKMAPGTWKPGAFGSSGGE